ncbi:MAG: tyrosine-type recombinase/integrase [Acidimicrobiales bacterium]
MAHPRALTDSGVNHWVAQARANNTRRNRLAGACTFLRWCVRQGQADPAMVEELSSRENPLRATPPLYGKLQGKYPARWLTHEEAFGALLGVCDASDLGRRDALVLRLGLAGMQVAEIVHLRVGDLRLGSEPTVEWIGKKSRPRKVAVGPCLLRLLDDYLDRYVDALDRPLRSSDPVACRQKPGGGVGLISWGQPFKQPCSVAKLVTLRADQAGLGHLSPHDLRRSTAGILHRAVSEDGSHHFDLLDIQKVLGHANPATTMRSYIDPLDNGVIRRAASVLD